MLEGEIREINLLERLVELWREKFTGAIRFENDGIIKILYFKGGDVLSASTNDRADSVDEILMRAGKVTRDHVKQALTKRKESETLGDALLNLGFITRKELTWGRRMQAISVIRSLGAWETGSFTIVADYLPKREEGTIFPAAQLLTELVVTDQDRARYEKLLDSGSAVFAKMPGFDESFRTLGLNDDAEAVVKHVDGVRTAAEVVAISGQEAFNSYKLLHALTLLGLLHRLQPSVKSAAPLAMADDFGFETAGVSDAADAWALPPLERVPEPEPPPAPEPTLELALPPIEEKFVKAAIEPRPAPGFGFDEAQVEAARKATLTGLAVPDAPRVSTPPARAVNASQSFKRAPLSTPAKPKKGSRYGQLVALLAIFVLAGAAYGGFLWWTARQAAPAVAQPGPQPSRPVIVTPQPAQSTGTIVELPAQTTSEAPLSTAAPVATTTTAKPVTITAPPPPATGDFAEISRAFLTNAKGTFTVQFGIMCDPGNVRSALRVGGGKVGLAPISLKGRACYRLFWGDYATREAAEAGVSELPQGLRESKPAVVSIPR